MSKPPTRHARKKPMRMEARLRRDAELRRRRLRRNTLLYGSVGAAAVVVALGVGFLINRGENPAAQGGAAAAATSTTVAPTTTTAPATNDARADSPTAPAQAACGAKTPKRVKKTTSYPAKPDKVIEDGVTYDAELRTSCGSFTIRLDAKAAPETVNSIVFLARKKYYDSTWFHRIVPGGDGQIGVIQGGDPTGTGRGDAGYVLPDEFPSSPSAYKRYSVAMANGGPGTTGTQFFVNFQDNSTTLQPAYTLIGEVVKGKGVVDKIAKTPVAGPNGDIPTEAVWIERMIIREVRA